MTPEKQNGGLAGVPAEPFSARPDPRFYFACDAFEKRLAMLASLVKGADVIVLVIGEPGSGKTTLLNRYLQQTAAVWKACRIRYHPAAAGRRQPAKDRGFGAYILQDAADPVIIVDDAHRLDRSRLRFLLKEALVPGGSQKIKRLVLFGPPELAMAVNAVSESFAADSAVNKIYLPALSREETAAYLQHRLAVAGWSGRHPFSAAVVKKIHLATGGIPGAVNEAARKLLVNAVAGRTTTKGFFQMLKNISVKKLTLSAAGILAVLLAALWLYPDGSKPKSKPAAEKRTARVFRAKIKPGQVMAQRTVRVKSPAPLTGTDGERAPEASGQGVAPQPPPTPKRVAPSSPPTPKRVSPPPAPIPKRAAAPSVAPRPPETKPPAAAAHPQPAAGPSAGPVSRAAAFITPGGLQREKWLLSQNPAHYTIQILGTRSEKSMLEFIRKNQLERQTELAFYKGSFKGKVWYRLLYGVFATQREARLTARTLPAQIQRTSPWVRRLSSVQRDIRR